MANLKIDYVEFQTVALAGSKDFFAKACGWTYVDYGPNYSAFEKAGIDGGLEGCEPDAQQPPLVVLKADDLEAALAQVEAAGGKILKPIFSFPGGRRFHFREPGGNEMAVWGA